MPYLIGISLWLAYQGKSFGRIDTPAGGVDIPDPGLSSAAKGFEGFQNVVKERLDRHDESLIALDEGLEELKESLLARLVRWVRSKS